MVMCQYCQSVFHCACKTPRVAAASCKPQHVLPFVVISIPDHLYRNNLLPAISNLLKPDRSTDMYAITW